MIRDSFDRTFRAKIEASRPWKLQFNDYLDIVVWDRHPGWEYESLTWFLIQVCFSSLFSFVPLITVLWAEFRVQCMHKSYKYKDSVSAMEPTVQVFLRTGMGDGDPAFLHSIRETFQKHRESEKENKDAFILYDSIDEEIDKECSPYDKSDSDDGEGEEDDWEDEDGGDEEGEEGEEDPIWLKAQNDAADLRYTVGGEFLTIKY